MRYKPNIISGAVPRSHVFLESYQQTLRENETHSRPISRYNQGNKYIHTPSRITGSIYLQHETKPIMCRL